MVVVVVAVVVRVVADWCGLNCWLINPISSQLPCPHCWGCHVFGMRFVCLPIRHLDGFLGSLVCVLEIWKQVGLRCCTAQGRTAHCYGPSGPNHRGRNGSGSQLALWRKSPSLPNTPASRAGNARAFMAAVWQPVALAHQQQCGMQQAPPVAAFVRRDKWGAWPKGVPWFVFWRSQRNEG